MSLWEMSVSGGILILVVLLVRSLFLHKLPGRTFQALWFLVLLRLLLPVSIPCKFSIYSVAEKYLNVSEHRLSDDVLRQSQEIVQEGLSGTDDSGAAVSSLEAKEDRGTKGSLGWTGIYLAGAAICAGWYLFSYLRWNREFQTSLPAGERTVQEWADSLPVRRKISIRQWDRTVTPLTYGIVRPVILLPKELVNEKPEQLRFILIHEYMHIRHWDALKKLFLIVTCCIHWFNPLVWVMNRLANQDLELACDKNVIKHMGQKMRTPYALALIHMEEERNMRMSWGNGFNENAIEERIVAIMKEKKISILACITSCVLTAAIVLAFATSALAMSGRMAQESTATYEGDSVEQRTVQASQATEVVQEISQTQEGQTGLYEEIYKQFSDEVGPDAAQAQAETKETYQGFCDVPKEYAALGITANPKSGGWEYDGKKVAILYDKGIYTFADKPDEKNLVYLEVCRDSKNKIKSFREVDKEGMQKLLKETGLVIE